LVLLTVQVSLAAAPDAVRAAEDFEHKFAANDGVKLHYAAAGQGPLVVFIHGFPDFWYSWRHQMKGLRSEYRVVAMDTRGYNLSDQPAKQEDYDLRLLVADVAAVIRSEGREKAVIVGHDWGGAIAWSFAAALPQMTEKLVIVNLPHPRGLIRELATNPEQQRNSQYARNFQQPNSHEQLSAEALAQFVAKDEETRERYIEAFRRSSLNGMMNYYRQNYPREPYDGGLGDLAKITVPVLQFHGLKDTALNARGLNQTWEWLEKDYTLVTLPAAGHWAHHDAAERVTETIRWWLKLQPAD